MSDEAVSVESTSILPALLGYREWLRTIDQSAKTWRIMELFVEAVISSTPADGVDATPVPWSSISMHLVTRKGDEPETALRKVAPPETIERWISVRETGYLQHCAARGIEPVRFKALSGRPLRYTFERMPHGEAADAVHMWRTEGAVLRWRRTEIAPEEMSSLGRRLYPNNRHEVAGWRQVVHYVTAFTMIGILFVLLFFAYVLFVAIQLGNPGAKMTTMVSLVAQILLILLYYRVFMVPMARAADMRTHPAHPMLVNFRDGIWVDRINANLGRRKGDPSYNRSSRPFRQMVRWEAECPICGSVVELKNDSQVAKNELVGCCVESPDEHSFTFDRVTLEGRPLRARPALPV